MSAHEPEKQETYHKLTVAINHAKDRGDLETLRQIAGDPHGFISRQGWASLDFRDEEQVARLLKLWVARASRVLAKASRLCELSYAFATRNTIVSPAIHIEESSSWRDAMTSTRDARATRNSPRGAPRRPRRRRVRCCCFRGGAAMRNGLPAMASRLLSVTACIRFSSMPSPPLPPI